jgi:hypothetical protein
MFGKLSYDMLDFQKKKMPTKGAFLALLAIFRRRI